MLDLRAASRREAIPFGDGNPGVECALRNGSAFVGVAHALRALERAVGLSLARGGSRMSAVACGRQSRFVLRYALHTVRGANNVLRRHHRPPCAAARRISICAFATIQSKVAAARALSTKKWLVEQIATRAFSPHDPTRMLRPLVLCPNEGLRSTETAGLEPPSRACRRELLASRDAPETLHCASGRGLPDCRNPLARWRALLRPGRAAFSTS